MNGKSNSPRENGNGLNLGNNGNQTQPNLNEKQVKKEPSSHSPHSSISSNSSTPSSKNREQNEKSNTPLLNKPTTPTSSGNSTPGSQAASSGKPLGPPVVNSFKSWFFFCNFLSLTFAKFDTKIDNYAHLRMIDFSFSKDCAKKFRESYWTLIDSIYSFFLSFSKITFHLQI